MMYGIKDNISSILVSHSDNEKVWNDIPVISIDKPDNELLGQQISELLHISIKLRPQKASKILANLIDSYPFTHILCQYGTYGEKFLNVWRDNKIPLFIHFHGYDVFFNLRKPDDVSSNAHNENYFSNIQELQDYSTFIAGSNFLKDQLLKSGLISKNIHVKYYGVPVSNVIHNHSRCSDVRILHLGRLVDFKSPDRTIQAFEIARSKGLKGHLDIVGDGPLRITCELLKLRSKYYDDISIHPPIYGEGAQSFYHGADIFTHHNIEGEITHQAEGFGVSIVEAMADGIPIVGTRSGGVVETVIDGETGVLVDPGDIEGQANAFINLAKDPILRQRLGDNGKKRVEEHFSPENERRKLIEIISSDNSKS